VSSKTKRLAKLPAADAEDTYILKNPIKISPESPAVTEFHFRELELGDLKTISLKIGIDGVAIDGQSVLTLIGKLTGQTEVVVSKIRGVDIGGVGSVALGFMGIDLTSIGGEESP